MHEDEIVVNIVGRAMIECPGIDQNILRGIVEETLYEYEINKKSTELAIRSDMQDRIMMYLATRSLDGLSKKTLKNYALHLKRFSNYTQKDVKDVTIMDIRMFLADLMKLHNLKNSSLETEKSIIKSFFSWLEDEDYIIKSPARKLKAIKQEGRLRKSLTAEELELLRDACVDTRQRAMLEFIFSTGGRLSEITQVDIFNINWSERSINIIGKGNKERTIYFSPKANIYIKKYLLERSVTESDALFISKRKPFERLSNRTVEEEISKIAQQAGF